MFAPMFSRLAVTDSTVENGCMRFVRGSHREPTIRQHFPGKAHTLLFPFGGGDHGHAFTTCFAVTGMAAVVHPSCLCPASAESHPKGASLKRMLASSKTHACEL